MRCKDRAIRWMDAGDGREVNDGSEGFLPVESC